MNLGEADVFIHPAIAGNEMGIQDAGINKITNRANCRIGVEADSWNVSLPVEAFVVQPGMARRRQHVGGWIRTGCGIAGQVGVFDIDGVAGHLVKSEQLGHAVGTKNGLSETIQGHQRDEGLVGVVQGDA